MTKIEIREYNRALSKLAKSGNKNLMRIARTYTTYRNKINDYERRGFITETLSLNNYIEAYQELEAKSKVLDIVIRSKSEKIADMSKIFNRDQFRAMKEKAAIDDEFRERIGLGSLDAGKVSMHTFMKKLQMNKMDRQDLWSACLESCGNDYDAADAMYNSLI